MEPYQKSIADVKSTFARGLLSMLPEQNVTNVATAGQRIETCAQGSVNIAHNLATQGPERLCQEDHKASRMGNALEEIFLHALQRP